MDFTSYTTLESLENSLRAHEIPPEFIPAAVERWMELAFVCDEVKKI